MECHLESREEFPLQMLSLKRQRDRSKMVDVQRSQTNSLSETHAPMDGFGFVCLMTPKSLQCCKNLSGEGDTKTLSTNFFSKVYWMGRGSDSDTWRAKGCEESTCVAALE